jgi:hypothetical protein
MKRYQVIDGFVFDRRFAVIDTRVPLNEHGKPRWILQTHDEKSAATCADEMNGRKIGNAQAQ